MECLCAVSKISHPLVRSFALTCSSNVWHANQQKEGVVVEMCVDFVISKSKPKVGLKMCCFHHGTTDFYKEMKRKKEKKQQQQRNAVVQLLVRGK